MADTVTCNVGKRRRESGTSLSELASRVGVSRQALTAIEAGRATPSTAVALRLAAALGCSVEDLFSLATLSIPELLVPECAGSRVALGRVSGRWVVHPLDLADVAAADAVVSEDGSVVPVRDRAEIEGSVLVAGCAPVLGVLAGRLARQTRVPWLYASSGEALKMLASGRIHVAGMHLARRDRPEEHDALIRTALGGELAQVVTLLSWREGLVTLPANPKGIRGAADLLRKGVRVARRPAGSGATRILEESLSSAGADCVPEFGPLVATHADAARSVVFGAADAAVVIEPVAEAFGLPFLPLSEERFELVFRSADRSHAGIAQLLDELSRSGFAREVSSMGAYDVAEIGATRRVAA